jgi:BolA protein
MNDDRMARIRSRIQAALSPEALDILDESHLHAGHEGARDGRGHFQVVVISPDFEGKSRIQRHRMVFDALGDLMSTDIHAVGVKAYTPDEI